MQRGHEAFRVTESGEALVKKLFCSMLTVAAVTVAFASNAEAAFVYCPAGATPPVGAGERNIGVDTTSGPELVPGAFPAGDCVASGDGNNPDPILPGYVLIDKEQSDSNEPAGLVITGLGATSGTFSFDVSLWSSFSNLIIVFKTGEGQADPDWAAFDLDFNTTSGLWEIVNPGPGSQSLSHASLYGLPGTTVPDGGATLGLLGLGMLGLGYLRRRRQ